MPELCMYGSEVIFSLCVILYLGNKTMTNTRTNINFRIEGGGIFMFNIDLLVTTVGALKEALQTLGHVTSINVTLCKIDLGREVDMTMRPGALVKDYFGGNDYPDL